MISQEEKKKRTEERKDEANKISTSIRLSPNDRKVIQEKASAKGMKPSEYIRDCALHGSDGLTPYAKMKVQNLVNTAYEQIKATDPENAEAMMKEMQEVWTL